GIAVAVAVVVRVVGLHQTFVDGVVAVVVDVVADLREPRCGLRVVVVAVLVGGGAVVVRVDGWGPGAVATAITGGQEEREKGGQHVSLRSTRAQYTPAKKTYTEPSFDPEGLPVGV